MCDNLNAQLVRQAAGMLSGAKPRWLMQHDVTRPVPGVSRWKRLFRIYKRGSESYSSHVSFLQVPPTYIEEYHMDAHGEFNALVLESSKNFCPPLDKATYARLLDLHCDNPDATAEQLANLMTSSQQVDTGETGWLYILLSNICTKLKTAFTGECKEVRV